MKSGCFFTAITFTTISIGILFYIGKKYGPELWEKTEEKIFSFAEKDINEKINSIKENEFKDSLKTLVNNHLKSIKDLGLEEAKNDSFHFFQKLDEFIDDKIINSEEFSILKEIQNKYER